MPAAPRRKRALLVGIDDYPNLGYYSQLKGCVNDARLMGGVLRDRFGFAKDDVTVLENAEATRDGILAALDALADRVGADDVVVLYYAGHGSQITDVEGDEPDGLDETLVPHDGVRESGPNTDVTDDELHAWVQRVTAETPHLTLLFDCCHSGTITRDASSARTRSLRPDTRPAEELGREPVATPTTRSADGKEGRSGWLPLADRYVLIAGCRDDEVANEHTDVESGAQHGALTFYLSQALLDATPGTTYRDVFERVRPAVGAVYPKQHPQMEGALDREIFGVRDVEPMRFVGVEGRDRDAVTLAGGAAHGLTVGSEWDVYPSGTKTTDGAEPVGRVAVRRVGAVSSTADVVDEAEGGAVEVGARAVLAVHAYAEAGLRVAVDVPEGHEETRTALVAEVERAGLLHAVGSDEPFDARAYVVPEREESAHPAPQLGAVAEATWAVVGADGELLMPTRPVGERGAVRVLRENLETVARYRNALALRNPDPRSPLRGALDLRLERQNADGTWTEAVPDEDGGEVVFHDGDAVAFTITNTSSRPLYVYAFDFGVDGAVSPLTMRGASEKLGPNQPFTVKALTVGGADYPITLYVPERFPGTEGYETLKVFATTHETRFDALTQAGTRSVSAPGQTPLQMLVDRAGGAGPTRKMTAGPRTGDAADWTTAERTFTLRRKTAALGEDGVGVDLGAVTIRACGLEGEVRRLATARRPARTRGGAAEAEHAPTALDRVLSQEHVETDHAVEIASARTRSLGADPTVEVEVQAPRPGEGQVVLYTDESGVTTWQVAEPAPLTRSAGPRTRRYRLDRAQPAPAAGAGTRGVVGAVGKKLIQVLVFPLVDPLVGRVSETYAERWEGKKRPYGLRPFSPDDFQSPTAPPLDGDAWRRLGAGRSLLFVHGTFSRAHSAFGGLSAETVAELHRRYGGRVFAFDHFTLSHDPKTNVERLLAALPDDAALDLDVVCHSRGGLVSRVLAERQSALSLGARSLRVGRVVFVASPNAGTHLADPEHMGALIDTYTNLLTLLPDNPVTDVLDGVVTVAKQLAVGALGGLKGLQSMRPGGDFLARLNGGAGPGDARYFALGADYEPGRPGLRSWVQDRLVGHVFGAENDLVVPTASVYEDGDGDGADLVAEGDRHVFAARDGVSHSSFFQHPAAQDKLLTWLQG